jgi:hypothetical protein
MQITTDNLPQFAAALVTAFKAAAKVSRFRNAVEVLPVRTHAEACQSLADLKKAVWAGVLPISTADSWSSIYGPQGNFEFRVWHDLGHLAHGLDMSNEDEQKLHVLLWAELLPHIPEELRWSCNVLYQADTSGQSWLHHFTGAFPVNQTAFCLAVAHDISTGSINVKDAVLRYIQAHNDLDTQRRSSGSSN